MSADDRLERRRRSKRRWAADNASVNAANAKRYTFCFGRLVEMYPEEYRDLVAIARASHPGYAQQVHYRTAKRQLRDRHRDVWDDLLAASQRGSL